MSDGPLIGVVTAGVVAGVVLILVIAILVYYCYSKKSSVHTFELSAYGDKAHYHRVHGYPKYPSVPRVAVIGAPPHVEEGRQPMGRMIFRPMPYDMYPLQPMPLTYPRVKKGHRQKRHVPNGHIQDGGVYLTDGEMSEFLHDKKRRKQKSSPHDDVDGDNDSNAEGRSQGRGSHLQENLRRSRSAESPMSNGQLQPYFTEELNAPFFEQIRANGDLKKPEQDINSNHVARIFSYPPPQQNINGGESKEDVQESKRQDLNSKTESKHIAAPPGTPPRSVKIPPRPRSPQRTPPQHHLSLQERQHSSETESQHIIARPGTPPRSVMIPPRTPTPPRPAEKTPASKPYPSAEVIKPPRPPTPPFDAASIDSQSVQGVANQSHTFRLTRQTPMAPKPARPPSPPVDIPSIDYQSVNEQNTEIQLSTWDRSPEPEYASVIKRTTYNSGPKNAAPPLPPKNKRSLREYLHSESEEDDSPVTVIDQPMPKVRPPTPPPIKKKLTLPSAKTTSSLEQVKEAPSDDPTVIAARSLMNSLQMEIKKAVRRRSHSNPDISDSLDPNVIPGVKGSRQRNPSEDFPPPDYDESDLNESFTRSSGLFKSASSKSLPSITDNVLVPITKQYSSAAVTGQSKSVKFAETEPVVIPLKRQSSQLESPPPLETPHPMPSGVPPAPPLPPPPPPPPPPPLPT